MTSVFNLDSEVLLVGSGSDCLWSPPEKATRPQEQCVDHQPIKFSPPSSKEAYQRIRNKYQVARSAMNKGSGSQAQSTRLVRRRQSFAISQMLQNVSTINSTPLKIGQLETDRLVDTLKKSAAKRKSLAPRSCRKSRAQVMRRVSKNIDDIFAAHFAEDEQANLEFLTGATPHHKIAPGQVKPGVRLLEKFDDDPFMNLLDESPLRSASARPSLSGLMSPVATKQTVMGSAGRSSIAPATPQSRRNSLCSPPPSRVSTAHRQSVSGSAVKLRDADFVTSSQKSSIKPPVPSATPTRVLASNRKSIAQLSSNSASSTPTRATSTPAGRTPLTFYTAAGSARRPTIPTPAASTPQRPKVAMTCSALKLKQLTAAKTPLSTMRNTLHTQVQLSVEKMGAFLQSMKKNDAKFKNASLTVSKARESSPGLSRTAQKSSTARTLHYNDAPSATKPAVERAYVYEADDDANVSGDLSGMLDEVLDINIEAMLQDYAADRLNRADSEDHEDRIYEQIQSNEEQASELTQNYEQVHIVEQEESMIELNAVVTESQLSASEVMDITAQDMDVTANDVEMSTCEMDCTACSPAFSINASAMEVDSPAAEMNGTLCEYASDSSSSPQILRVRYSAGNTSRRSLSNARGRLSMGATDILALDATENTSPLVFTAPAAPSDLLSPALVHNARVEVNKNMKTISTPVRSMLKGGPVRLLQSASKAVHANPAMYSARSVMSPMAKHRSAYNSDSDTDLNTSLQSTGKKVIRNVNVQSTKGRRKSLACATSSTVVSSMLKKFDLNKTAPLETTAECAAEQTSQLDTSATLSALKSILEMSPRLTRSAAKSTASAIKAKELLASPRTTSKQSPRPTTEKKSVAQTVNAAELVDFVAEIVSPAASKSAKKGRKSTAKKATATTTTASAVEQETTAAVEVLQTLSPIASVNKASSKKSALKSLASPAVPPPSATRSYSLRSATKAAVVEESAQALTSRAVKKTLFPEECDNAENAEDSENAAPSNVTQASTTPVGKAMRASSTKTTTAKTPVGAYTAAKVKRHERNQKLDALFGTCEELLSMIDASVV